MPKCLHHCDVYDNTDKSNNKGNVVFNDALKTFLNGYFGYMNGNNICYIYLTTDVSAFILTDI